MSALSPEDVADGRAEMERTYARPTYAGICVADGFGVKVTVERGALEVHDGIGAHRRTRRFDKATHGLSRLVIANADGFVSLSALRWCEHLRVGVLVLGPDGGCEHASTPRVTDDARLRRTQALAPERPYGLDLARKLIGTKLRGQAGNLRRYFRDEGGAETILGLVEALVVAGSVEEARQLEASAAALYFGAWSGRNECVPRFATAERRRVPAHWLSYEGRRSVLASAASNRKAERPVNAILNYCFSLLEAEAILACQVVGLDPGLGIVHADARGRASMALDLIEPVRPEVESFVLRLLSERTFRKAEFTETPDGHVRLLAPLTHELAERMPAWARMLAPHAEAVAHLLGAAMQGKFVAATPLTSTRLKAAQAMVKARKAEAKGRASAEPRVRQKPAEVVSLPIGCVDCGQVVTNPRRVRCDECLSADPRQAVEVRGRRAAAISARKRALRERQDARLPEWCDRNWYDREIAPRLGGFKLAEIMEAAGCSKASASDYRRGKHIPHVSTWPSLVGLIETNEEPDPASAVHVRFRRDDKRGRAIDRATKD